MDEIKQYMGTSLLTAEPDTSAAEAAKLMAESKVGSILIAENGKYRGIVTEMDFTRKVIGEGRDPSDTKVSSIMSGPIKTLDCNQTMDEAFLFMHQNNIRHLPVTDQGEIAGIISIRDVARYYNEKFVKKIDPITEFWENYECLVGRTAFLHALERLLKGMRETLDDTSKTAQAIDRKDPYDKIARAADEEGLIDFAEILHRA